MLDGGYTKWAAESRPLTRKYPEIAEGSYSADPFSLEACGEALDLVLARQNPDSTVLVAHGFGGMVALYALQAQPERLKGLILIDAATRTTVPIPEQQQQFFLRMLDTGYDDFLKRTLRAQARDSVQANELYAQAQSVQPATMKAYLKMALNADASSALKKVKAPVLFVGSSKTWTEAKDWPTLAKEMGYDDPALLTARRVGESGALIMKEQPDSLAAAIGEFTAQVLAKKK